MTSRCLLAFFILTAASAHSQTPQPSQPATNPATATSKPRTEPANLANDDEGSEIFAVRCSRCHNAPDGFPPRVAGTILRHMRVRASLSEHEEKELLRFLNP
jgi:cytochrome c5